MGWFTHNFLFAPVQFFPHPGLQYWGGREGRGSMEGNNMEEGFKERESLLVGDYIRKPVIKIVIV